MKLSAILNAEILTAFYREIGKKTSDLEQEKELNGKLDHKIKAVAQPALSISLSSSHGSFTPTTNEISLSMLEDEEEQTSPPSPPFTLSTPILIPFAFNNNVFYPPTPSTPISNELSSNSLFFSDEDPEVSDEIPEVTGRGYRTKDPSLSSSTRIRPLWVAVFQEMQKKEENKNMTINTFLEDFEETNKPKPASDTKLTFPRMPF
jgi:hypothetical protein